MHTPSVQGLCSQREEAEGKEEKGGGGARKG